MALHLVTGGAGLQSAPIWSMPLLARGDRLRVLDDFSTGSWTTWNPCASAWR